MGVLGVLSTKAERKMRFPLLLICILLLSPTFSHGHGKEHRRMIKLLKEIKHAIYNLPDECKFSNQEACNNDTSCNWPSLAPPCDCPDSSFTCSVLCCVAR